MDLKNLSNQYKGINNNLPFSTNLQLERTAALVEERYSQVKFFFTRMHWASLRNLGQMSLNQSIGIVYQLIAIQKEMGEAAAYSNPNSSFWMHQIKSSEDMVRMIRDNYPSLHEALEANSWERVKDIITKHKKEQREKAIILSHKVVGLLVKSLLSILHGNINAEVADWKDQYNAQRGKALVDTYMVEHKETILSEAKEVAQSLHEAIDQKIFELYQTVMQAGQEVGQLLPKAIEYLHWTSKQLIEIGDLQNLLNAYMASLQTQRKNSFSEQIGYQAAQLGHSTRHLIASVASVFHLVFDLVWEGNSPLLDGIRDRGFDLPDLPNGKNTAIHNLDKLDDGAFVEVAGFVKTIEALRTSKGALICRAELYDPSSKKSVWVATLYTHLAHLGIDDNAYVIAHGELHHKSNLAQEERAIHIDLLAQAELKKQSWKMLFLEAASPYYQVWYNGLNMQWSLTKHLHEYKENTFYVEKTGASEMIFQPLYRDEAYQQERKEKYTQNQ